MLVKARNLSYSLNLVTAFVLLISGCAGVENASEAEPKSFNQIKQSELQYYDPQQSIGLALSGGGTRSASFHIGVLAGLNQISHLENIDIISSVSGGSYAAYWYFSKLYYQSLYDTNDSPNDLFSFCYSNPEVLDEGDIKCTNDATKERRFQRHLSNNSLILKKHALGFQEDDDIHFGHFIPIALRTIVEAPTSNVLEFFGSDNNLYSARDYYREGLERTYGLYPAPTNTKGFMKESFLGEDDSLYRSQTGHKYRAESLYLLEFQKQLYSEPNQNNTPPLWVINTTVAPSNDFRFTRLYTNPYKTEPFSNSIYEITPFSVGSGTTGYLSISDANKMHCQLMGDGNHCLRTISDYVALSGAAVDVTPYTDFGGTIGLTLASILGIELGDYSLNPTEYSQPAYLSDGGHSDNLGAYSLIKRGVNKIIISDAEKDSKGEAEGLRRLAKQLMGEGKKIVFYHGKDKKPIEELNSCLYSDDSQCMTIAYDERPDSKRKARDWELEPVLRANVQASDGTILHQIYYIKLRALDRYHQEAQQLGYVPYSNGTTYLISNENDTDRFPHVSTMDINFSPTQYFAYFNTGRFYGKVLKNYLEEY